ncbi:MAG: histidinol-phosphatase [Kiritimatiellae bacterium]|nr:histidinol-phosphatase [Kiritimatiellia bacterium]
MKANLHTHTFRCGHATGTDREYVEAAIAAGLEVLGFSDHCPWPWPDGYVSRMRMPVEAAAGYFESILELRDEYRGRIEIYAGFEAEHFPALVGARDELYSRWPLDFLILGQHYIDDERDKNWKYSGTRSPVLDTVRLAKYVDRCIAAVATGKYLYVAHPDVLNFGPGDDEAAYEREFGRLCDCLRDNAMPVELNLLGLRGRRHYPSERFLRLAADHGCDAALGLDAHSPEDFSDLRELEDEARAMCARAGIKLVEPPLPSRR